jgi:hypothetical protein
MTIYTDTPPAGKLFKHYRIKWAQLSGNHNIEDIELSTADSMRDLFSSTLTQVDILDTNRFKLTIPIKKYLESIKKDLTEGAQRIDKQQQHLSQLLDQNSDATGWIITTSYYLSYFLAVELLKGSGSPIHYISSSECKKILSRAHPSAHNLTQESYVGKSSLEQSEQSCIITFSIVNTGNHAVVWSTLLPSIVASLDKHDNITKNLHAALDERSPSPPTISRLRHRWNYRDPQLYSKKGKDEGVTYRKIITSGASAYKWGKVKKNLQCPKEQTAVLALTNTILYTAYSQFIWEVIPQDHLPQQLRKAT